jgi:hypothetical protein
MDCVDVEHKKFIPVNFDGSYGIASLETNSEKAKYMFMSSHQNAGY